MAGLKTPAPVKLFVVTLHRDANILDQTLRLLTETWGETDFQSTDFPFDETNYYEK